MISNSQIDKIGSRLRSGSIDGDCLEKLEFFRKQFTPAYEFTEDVLVNKMGLKITGRPSKSTVAIIEKLKRGKMRLSQMQDVAGCRVLVPHLAAQDRLVQNLEVMLLDVEIDDKRKVPTNGYRAVHVIAKQLGRPVEIQVRTNLQHVWANLSEKVADQFGHSIKYGAGDAGAISFLNNLSDETALLEDVRHRKLYLSQRKARLGKSKGVVRQSKLLNYEEREILRRIRRLFA